MRPGLLNSRVVVQQQSTTQDALGQPVLSWSTFATLWANVRHTSGVEAIIGSIRELTKLRGDVVLVAVGSLAQDGKVIDDMRDYK